MDNLLFYQVIINKWVLNGGDTMTKRRNDETILRRNDKTIIGRNDERLKIEQSNSRLVLKS